LNGPKEIRYDAGYIGKWSKLANFTFTVFRKKLSGTPVYQGSYTYSGMQVPYYSPSFIRRYGFESEIKGEIFDGMSYFANYAFIHSRDYVLEAEEPNIPQHVGSFGFTYQHRGWDFNALVQRVSGYRDNFLVTGNNYVKIGDYWQGDLNVSYEFKVDTKTHKIYLSVRNIGDVRYQTVPGWRDFGREIYVGYDLKF
jgi:outer membrane cobalamin receptor